MLVLCLHLLLVIDNKMKPFDSEHLACPSSHNRCSTPKTSWLLAILAMGDTWRWRRCLGAESPWRRSMSSYWPCRIKTRPTLWIGFLTMLKPLSVTYLRGDWKWPPLSLVIRRLFKSCLSELEPSSLQCLEGRPFFIGIQVITSSLTNLIFNSNPVE